MENSNCCSPNQDTGTSCCTPTAPVVEEKTLDLKKKLGLVILGLAFVFTISSAFRTVANTNDIGALPPSIEDFDWIETEKEVAYIFLQGEEEELNKQMSAQITGAIAELNGTDGSAEYIELGTTSEQYNSFVETMEVTESPSVVVLGRIGNPTLLNGESISPIKLYKAYVAAITPAASCNPASCAPASTTKTCTPAQKAKCAAKKGN